MGAKALWNEGKNICGNKDAASWGEKIKNYEVEFDHIGRNLELTFTSSLD